MTNEEFKKLDFNFKIAKEFTFVDDVGSPTGNNTACIMSAAAFIVAKAKGKEHSFISTDKLSCVDNSIRNLCIDINDSFGSYCLRKRWALKYIPKILGTAFASDDIKARRAEIYRKFSKESDQEYKTIKQKIICLNKLLKPRPSYNVVEQEEEHQQTHIVEQTLCRI